jgi:ankyrin repeat protein
MGGVTSAKQTSESSAESWRVTMLKHVRRGSDLDEIVEAIEESRLCGEVSDYRDVSSKDWLTGNVPEWPRPWMALVRLKKVDWVFVAGPAADAERVARYGKSRSLQTIVAGYDADAAKSHFRSYEGGKIAIDYSAGGQPNQPIKKAKLKSATAIETVLASAATPIAAVGALLEHVQGSDLRLDIVREDGKLRVVALNGAPLVAGSVKEICVVEFWPLMPGDNAASDALNAALRAGDPVGTQEAIAAGADLNYLPVTHSSPFDLPLLNRKGNWEECVQVLVDAGAPLNGFPQQPPTIYRCVWSVFPIVGDNPAPIAAIEVLLKLGADINARCEMRNHHDWTALHKAVDEYNPLLVKYLVWRGADTNLEDDQGRTPISLAQFDAEHVHGEAKAASIDIAEFIANPQDYYMKRNSAWRIEIVEPGGLSR